MPLFRGLGGCVGDAREECVVVVVIGVDSLGGALVGDLSRGCGGEVEGIVWDRSEGE